MASKRDEDVTRLVVEDFQQSLRGRVDLEREWIDFWKIYLTQQRHNGGKYQSKAISPHGAMTIRQLVPLIKRQILATRPFIRAVPRKPGLDDQSYLIESLLDYWIDVADVRHQFLTLALKEALIFGTGWVKVWHDTQARYVTKEEPDPYTGEIQKKEEAEILYSGPRVQYVPIHEVFPDMVATSLEDARFIAHRFFRKKTDLLADPMYDYDSVKSIDVESPVSATRTSIPLQQIFEEQRRRILKIPLDQLSKTNENLQKEGDGLVELIEYVADGRVVTVANRSVVIRAADLDHPLPWVAIVPDPVPGELFGKSVLFDAKPSIDQRDFIIRSIFDNIANVIYKRFVGIPGMYDPRTLLGPPGSVVSVRDINAIQPLEQSDISGSAFAILTHLERDIERGTGLAEPLSAVGPSGPVYNETATTTMAKQEMGLLFVGEMVANIERSLKRLAHILFDIESQYFTAEGGWVRLMGEEGARWRPIDSDVIASDWDFRVVGSEYVAGKQAQMQALSAALPMLLQIYQMQPNTVDLLELAKAVTKVLQLDQIGRIVPGRSRDMGPDVEHQVMRTGQWVDPEEDEDIEKHIEAHYGELQRAQQEHDDPEYIERLQDHLEKTLELYAELAQRAQVAAQMAAEDGEVPEGAMPGGAPEEGQQ